MPNLDGIGLSGCLNRRSSTLGDQIRLAKRSTIRSRLQPPNWRMARLVRAIIAPMSPVAMRMRCKRSQYRFSIMWAEVWDEKRDMYLTY